MAIMCVIISVPVTEPSCLSVFVWKGYLKAMGQGCLISMAILGLHVSQINIYVYMSCTDRHMNTYLNRKSKVFT